MQKDTGASPVCLQHDGNKLKKIFPVLVRSRAVTVTHHVLRIAMYLAPTNLLSICCTILTFSLRRAASLQALWAELKDPGLPPLTPDSNELRAACVRQLRVVSGHTLKKKKNLCLRHRPLAAIRLQLILQSCAMLTP